jgi:alpha-ribazole phosphatase
LIYLFRHGEVEMAETRRFIGHLDVRLSALGERQGAAQGRRLSSVKLAGLFASDLVRARRTGELIGVPQGLVPVPVPALREMSMGRWEGLTAAEIRLREPEKFAEWMAHVGEFPFPDGESLPDLEARAWPAFESIADAHPGRAIVIVAHGGTNRALICRALGLPLGRILALGQDYGALTVLERVDATWHLRRLNERPVV